MEFRPTDFEGLLEIYPTVIKDERGHFYEEFHLKKFLEAGISLNLVQSNQSFSRKGVIRGLHLQLDPYAQSKLVKVLKGRALDIVVDVRRDSATFGKHFKCELSSDNGNMLYVPKGFAHGFAALEDTVFHYACDEFYHPEAESGFRWDDADLGIDWEIMSPIVSQKDQGLPIFSEFVQQTSA